MPLEPGSSNSVVSRNISEMIHSGHDRKQSIAAALHNADQFKQRRAAGGGSFNLGDTLGGLFGGGGLGGFGGASSPWSRFQSNPEIQKIESALTSRFGGQSGLSMPFGSQPVGQPPMAPIGHMAPLPPSPTAAAPSGPTNQTMFRAGGGGLPWYTRNEARSMLHTGPIKSPVAGRTDHIPLKVLSGSYVLPADHISHMGQNNTEAGLARAAHMFGGAGPFGTAMPKVAGGRGAQPHAPPVSRPSPNPGLKMASSIFAQGGKTHEGTVRGGDEGVDIMAAGGEFVIPPEVVAAVGGGNLDHGHQILDEWVMRMRKEHKKKLATLPPPAK